MLASVDRPLRRVRRRRPPDVPAHRPARRSTSTPTPRSGCSPASSSPSRSRRRCSRCTPGWPTRPRRPPPARACCWSASSTRSARTAMLRFCLGLFPDASQWATPFVVALALISIVYGALVAIGQDDILRLIGLTSLSHFGFIVLGIFVFTSAGHVRLDPLHGQPRRRARPRCSWSRATWSSASGTASISGDQRRREDRPGAGRALPGLRAGGARPARAVASSSPRSWCIIAAFQHHWWVGAIAVTGIVLAAWSTSSGCTSASSPARASPASSRSRTSTAARSARSRRCCWRWCCSASTRCRCST